ncbi:MAG: DUF3710 domain-containing protein [Frankia sp.]|nr:DUF3710 domain-containing protein [Frankia sp.]
MVFRRGRKRRDRVDDETPQLDEEPDEAPAPPGDPDGPYDVALAPRDDVQRLDVGALRVPALQGIQVQFQVEESSGRPMSVVVADGRSAMELAVFAAPKSSGLWDAVRADIIEQLRAGGREPRTVTGRYGPELELTLPTPTPGQVVPGRMIGVDGPRWFLRAVLTGPGALDPAQAPLLDKVLRLLVVVRGEEAMPVRDPLPLRLPKEVAESAQAAAAARAAGRAGPGTDSRSGRPGMPVPGARIAEVR